MKPFRIVFVCTGNICRSPMAEGILREMLIDEAELSGTSLPIEVTSAGTHAMDGFYPSEFAVVTAAEEGIDISSHLSRFLTGKIVTGADLMLTMERSHTEMITNHWPDISAVYELKVFARHSGDIPSTTGIDDPIGSGIGVYRTVFGEIKREIERVKPVVIDLALKKTGADE